MADVASAPKMLIDTSHLPVLVVRYLDDFDADELEAHIAELDAVVQAQKGPWAMVIEMAGGPPLSGRVRDLSVDFWRRNRGHMKKTLRSLTYVTSNKLMMGVVYAGTWLFRLPTKVGVASTVADAVASAQVQLNPRSK